MEAVQNATKHSGAETVVVRVAEDAHHWRLTVTDDGTGFDQDNAAATSGSGLANMRDRLDAVGGTVEVACMESTGTTVTAVVPRTDDAMNARETLSLYDRVV
jgi:signal transduction histidine kinase